MLFTVTVILFLLLTLYALFNPFRAVENANCVKVKVEPIDIYRKCIVITGGSNGIGLLLAKKIVDSDGRVILSSRSHKTIKEIDHFGNELFGPGSYLGGNYLDLDDLQSIKDFAGTVTRIVKHHCARRLDYLYLNAAMMYTLQSTEYVSKDKKHDKVFASNFIGNQLLIKELFSLIKESNTKIIVVSSVNHYVGNLNDILKPNLFVSPEVDYAFWMKQIENRYFLSFLMRYWRMFLVNTQDFDLTSSLSRYATSKLALNSFASYLTTKHNMSVVVGTPGAVITNILSSDRKKSSFNQKGLFHWLQTYTKSFLQFKAEEGADTVFNFMFLKPNTPAFNNRFFAPFLLPENVYGNRHYEYFSVAHFAEVFLQRRYYESGYLFECKGRVEEILYEEFDKQKLK